MTRVSQESDAVTKQNGTHRHSKMEDADKFVVLKSSQEYFHNNKKVKIDKDSGFIHFVGLVKAVCKTDFEGTNSNRFWNRLEPEISKSDYKIRKDIVYVSYKAVEKLATMNATSCKKTWGVFVNDGLTALLKDMKLLQKKRGPSAVSSPPASAEPSSSKKGKSQVSAEAGVAVGTGVVYKTKAEFLKAHRDLITAREKNLNNLETTLIERVAVLNKRESMQTSKEEELSVKEAQLIEREARLTKKEREMEVPDVSQFLSQVSSLANKFKAKAARSRRNSSEERQSGSVTPNDSEVTDKSSPLKSPSPIPPSEDDDDGDNDDEVSDLFLILLLFHFHFIYVNYPKTCVLSFCSQTSYLLMSLRTGTTWRDTSWDSPNRARGC